MVWKRSCLLVSLDKFSQVGLHTDSPLSYLAKVLNTVGITDKRSQNLINLGLTCWNLITGCSSALLSSKLKRRTQYLIAFSGMTILFACWTGASANYAQTKNEHAAGAVVAMIFIYYMFYTVMHPMTYIYITEVFPFVHRAKGVGLTQTFSRAGSAFNQFVNPIALEALNWKLYIVYVVSPESYDPEVYSDEVSSVGWHVRLASSTSCTQRPKDLCLKNLASVSQPDSRVSIRY